MKILVIGGGGREHALAWKIAQSRMVEKVFCAPGNGGTALEDKVENIDVAAADIPELLAFATSNKVDLTVVGPEQPLVAGIVDEFEAAGLTIFGPSKAAAQLEGSKKFAKQIMAEAGVPTAAFHTFTTVNDARKHIQTARFPLVIKADGLAAGKGVGVCQQLNEADTFLDRLENEPSLQQASTSILIEDFIAGREVSFIGLCSGEDFELLMPARDYKRLNDRGQGPNTGGMGAYTPVDDVNSELRDRVGSEVFERMLRTMKSKGSPFRGVLYAGLMVDDNNQPHVLEFNVRFGDPEAQPLLLHMQSDVVPQLLAIARGQFDPTPMLWKSGASLCVVLASDGYPAAYEKGIEIPNTITKTASDLKVFHAGSKLQGERLVTSGGRVLGVAATSTSVAAAREHIYSHIPKLAFNGAHFRQDIGL